MPGIHGSASHQHEPFRYDAYRNGIRNSNAPEVNKPAAQPDTSTASAVPQATQTLAAQAIQTLATPVPPPVKTTQAPQGPQVPPQPPALVPGGNSGTTTDLFNKPSATFPITQLRNDGDTVYMQTDNGVYYQLTTENPQDVPPQNLQWGQTDASNLNHLPVQASFPNPANIEEMGGDKDEATQAALDKIRSVLENI